MVTGASTADLSVVLIDARRGVLEQSKRHAFISALLGIPHMVVAINKMDLVDYSQERFEELVEEFAGFAAKLSRGAGNRAARRTRYHLHPDLGAQRRQRRRALARRCRWYDGPVLLDLLEQVEVAYDHPYDRPARFPVQWVIRPANGDGATTAATPVSSPAARCAAATRWRSCPAAQRTRSRRSTPTTASSRRRWRRCR